MVRPAPAKFCSTGLSHADDRSLPLTNFRPIQPAFFHSVRQRHTPANRETTHLYPRLSPYWIARPEANVADIPV